MAANRYRYVPLDLQGTKWASPPKGRPVLVTGYWATPVAWCNRREALRYAQDESHPYVCTDVRTGEALQSDGSWRRSAWIARRQPVPEVMIQRDRLQVLARERQLDLLLSVRCRPAPAPARWGGAFVIKPDFHLTTACLRVS